MTGARPDRVAVVGLGLMGGSLARDLAALPRPPRIVGWSQERADLDAAHTEGVVDEVASTDAEAAASGGLVVYATPLAATLQLVDRHRERWAPGAVVTDVASLKTPVVRRMRELGVAHRYVGSHPMAGGEGSGYGASRSELYRGARVWLTGPSSSEAARTAVESLWHSVGGEPVWTDPEEHDRRMVWASHLPQLVANALATVLEEAGLEPEELGPGGGDMTRLAGSSPDMWRDLFDAAGTADARALRALVNVLEEFAGHLETDQAEAMTGIMERTRAWRGRASTSSGRHPDVGVAPGESTEEARGG